MRESLARLGIGCTLLLGALGQVITFVPGVEARYFGVVALFALAGLLSRDGRVRLAGVALAGALGGLAGLALITG